MLLSTCVLLRLCLSSTLLTPRLLARCVPTSDPWRPVKARARANGGRIAAHILSAAPACGVCGPRAARMVAGAAGARSPRERHVRASCVRNLISLT